MCLNYFYNILLKLYTQNYINRRKLYNSWKFSTLFEKFLTQNRKLNTLCSLGYMTGLTNLLKEGIPFIQFLFWVKFWILYRYYTLVTK